MSVWSQNELKIANQESNLYISISNPDGSIHKPTWIWFTVVGKYLYCRGAAGTKARWYQSAKREGKGRVSFGGVEKDVKFEFPTDKKTLDQVDASYRKKYNNSSYLDPLFTNGGHQSNVRLLPTN